MNDQPLVAQEDCFCYFIALLKCAKYWFALIYMVAVSLKHQTNQILSRTLQRNLKQTCRNRKVRINGSRELESCHRQGFIGCSICIVQGDASGATAQAPAMVSGKAVHGACPPQPRPWPRPRPCLRPRCPPWPPAFSLEGRP
jgi:hypothetical protein